MTAAIVQSNITDLFSYTLLFFKAPSGNVTFLYGRVEYDFNSTFEYGFKQHLGMARHERGTGYCTVARNKRPDRDRGWQVPSVGSKYLNPVGRD